MTVARLAWTLVRGMLAGSFRPGDRVVREWGCDPEGHPTYKEVIFAETRHLREYPDPHPCPDAIHHPMFGRGGELAVARTVKLD